MTTTRFPGRFCVIVRPSRPKTLLRGYDPDRDAYLFDIAASPEDGKANVALLKHLRKEHGIVAEIVTGATSRKKTLKVTQVL